MRRLTLCIVMIVFLNPSARADEDFPHNPADRTSVLPSNVIRLQRLENSREVAALLHAVANLIDVNSDVKTRPIAPTHSHANDQPTTIVIQLENASAETVATALRDSRPSCRHNAEGADEGLVVLPERRSNSLLIRGHKEIVEDALAVVRQLDKSPELVLVQLLVAERVQKEKHSTDGPFAGAPDIHEHGEAWFDWAKGHGLIRILSRPQIMTQNNQAGIVQMGDVRQNPADLAGSFETGLSIGVTPRIAKGEDTVVIELDAARSSAIQTEGTQTVKLRESVQTTVTAGDGKTVVVSGLVPGADKAELIIAVTPHIKR